MTRFHRALGERLSVARLGIWGFSAWACGCGWDKAETRWTPYPKSIRKKIDQKLRFRESDVGTMKFHEIWGMYSNYAGAYSYVDVDC
jgi:hypothetical protein